MFENFVLFVFFWGFILRICHGCLSLQTLLFAKHSPLYCMLSSKLCGLYWYVPPKPFRCSRQVWHCCPQVTVTVSPYILAWQNFSFKLDDTKWEDPLPYVSSGCKERCKASYNCEQWTLPCALFKAKHSAAYGSWMTREGTSTRGATAHMISCVQWKVKSWSCAMAPKKACMCICLQIQI